MVTLVSIADTTVSSSFPTYNFGSLPDLMVGRAVGKYEGYVLFDLTNVAFAKNAMLDIWVEEGSDLASMNLKRVSSTWNELTTTWSNKPSSAPEPIVVCSRSIEQHGHLTIDVTDLVNSMISYGNHGFSFASDGLATLKFKSKEYSIDSCRPQLIITEEESAHAITFASVPLGATLEVDGVEII